MTFNKLVLSVFWISHTTNTTQYNGFLQIETQHEVANELFAKG